MAKKNTTSGQTKDMDLYLTHYDKGTQEVQTRLTRKNGWNAVINAYMNRLPSNWPFTSHVTVPLIRTTILEKTARLLNSKLQGRLIPREGGDVIKARINNALLEFQWDFANQGGSMIEKVATADQYARLFGGSFALVYWDTKKESNEIKIIDPRDIFFDGSATHIYNAKWVQVREWTTWKVLEARGFDVKTLRSKIKKGEVTSGKQDTRYTSQVKANKGVQNRVGEIDDPKNPVIEVVTEYTSSHYCVFLPAYKWKMDTGKNKYDHGQIPIAQLRYYPLGDDIYGESEVEPVLSIQRAANAILCGTIDEGNITSRPPLKIASSGVRIETIEYGPGARWIMNNPNLVQEMQFGQGYLSNFNSLYPAVVSAFNTAMGDKSLGINAMGKFDDKTATEVRSIEGQQNNRDQYNQLYLSEFLKNIVMMWFSNNKQYLFDDTSKKYYILKIIGKQNVQYFQQMQLDEMDIPDYAMEEIAQTIEQSPNAVSDSEIEDITNEVAVPTNPVETGELEFKRKLDVTGKGDEADLYIDPSDMIGIYDYIPDVASMATGAGNMLKEVRERVFQDSINPQVQQLLAAQNESINIKELLVDRYQDAGYRDPESLFTKNEKNPNEGGANPSQTGASPNQPSTVGGVPQLPQASTPAISTGGLPAAGV